MSLKPEELKPFELPPECDATRKDMMEALAFLFIEHGAEYADCHVNLANKHLNLRFRATFTLKSIPYNQRFDD